LPKPELSSALLGWYDTHARKLAWRIGPQDRAAGQLPDPYRVWLSEIMLQQTTVATVQGYFQEFTRRWPTLAALAAAPDSDVMAAWAGLGYYARARNLLACARIVSRDYAGRFPDNHAALLALPGVGTYTAAAIGAIAFERPQTVVDGNDIRVMARYFAVRDTVQRARKQLVEHATSLTPKQRCGDYAQAIMDLGATVCTPRNPTCSACPWQPDCRASALGIQHELPAKKPRPAKPTRFGTAYLARRTDGAWLLERRPENGLLGGMLGWPGSEWGAVVTENPPLCIDWSDPGQTVRHTFTHFHLHLSLRIGLAPLDAHPTVGRFHPEQGFSRADLPTLMRKAYDIAASSLKPGLCNDHQMTK